MDSTIPASVPPTGAPPVPAVPVLRDAPLPSVPPSTASARQRVLVALVASLAVIAFVESYQGLYRAAVAGGRPWPWLWPCAVEGFTLAMNVAIWDARSEARRAPWAWFLLILATAVSTALQVLDSLGTPLGVLTAGWTPLALLLSFERWMWLAYGGHRRQPPAPAPVPAPVPPTPAARDRARPAARSRRGTGRGARSTSDKIRAFVLAERAEGRDPSAAEAARRFGADPSLGRRIVRELAATNGHATEGGPA
jgi:hypothetical protein